MSLRPGPKSRAPAHQNAYAFKHNKNSKKSRQIKALAHWGLCRRCNEKIEWRKKYRKYKPIKSPGHCNQCQQRNVKRAYHTICDPCSKASGKCAWCNEILTDENAMEQDREPANPTPSAEELAEMSERQRRTALRKAAQKPKKEEAGPTGSAGAGGESMDEEHDGEGLGDDDEMVSDDEDL